MGVEGRINRSKPHSGVAFLFLMFFFFNGDLSTERVDGEEKSWVVVRGKV